MKIYQAGSLFTEAEQEFNRKVAVALREAGHEVFLPQEHEQQLVAGYPATIFAEDVRALEASDLVVAILDGSDVDSGTAWECGFAYARGKPIVGLRTDFRIYGKEERVNLMIEVPCRSVVRTVEEVVSAVAQVHREHI